MCSCPGSPRVAWAEIAPGPQLGAVLEAMDLRSADEFELVEAAKACERQIAYLHAMQARVVQELSTREDYAVCGACEDTEMLNEFHTHDRADATGQELSPALTLPPNDAKNHADLAIELVEERHSTFRALQAGRISWGKARIIVCGIRWLEDPWLQAEVEDRLLEIAPGVTERRRLSLAQPGRAHLRRSSGGGRADHQLRAVRRAEPRGEATRRTAAVLNLTRPDRPPKGTAP